MSYVFNFILAAKEDTDLYVLKTYKKKTNLIAIYLFLKVGSRERFFKVGSRERNFTYIISSVFTVISG